MDFLRFFFRLNPVDTLLYSYTPRDPLRVFIFLGVKTNKEWGKATPSVSPVAIKFGPGVAPIGSNSHLPIL